MPKVLCELPNAANVINGVKFTSDRGQMISDDITDAQAAVFSQIPGFRTVATPKPPQPFVGKAAAAAAAQAAPAAPAAEAAEAGPAAAPAAAAAAAETPPPPAAAKAAAKDK